jgi:TonB family protein
MGYDSAMTMLERAALALILLCLPLVVLAQEASSPSDMERWGSQSFGRSWGQTFKKALEDLKMSDPSTARKTARRLRNLFGEVTDAFVTGEQGTKFLGHTAYLLAVAEYRLGQTDEAAWHWSMAQNFAPDLRVSFEYYPDVVPFLRENLIPASWWEAMAKRLRGEKPDKILPPAGCEVTWSPAERQLVTSPELKTRVSPHYPRGASEFRMSGPTVIEAYIDQRGVPKAPMVGKSCGVPVFDIVAMEAVGHWRYVPAKLRDQPICVYMMATVNFELR